MDAPPTESSHIIISRSQSDKNKAEKKFKTNVWKSVASDLQENTNNIYRQKYFKGKVIKIKTFLSKLNVHFNACSRGSEESN